MKSLIVIKNQLVRSLVYLDLFTDAFGFKGSLCYNPPKLQIKENSMENSENPDESQYPSTDLAYEFVQSSYDIMSSRFDSANSRIQNILTWSIGITAAVPLFTQIAMRTMDIKSLWFFLALGTFVLTVILGVIAQKTGGVQLLDPKVLYNENLSMSHWEFKKTVLYWSGEAFNANNKTIQIKSRYIDLMTILLGLEIVFAVMWVIKT
jgi:hypothetical protein